MPAPLQIRALRALKARLEAISIDAGYLTDAGERVFLGRRNLEEVDCPCIIVTDAGDAPANEQNSGNSMSMLLAQTFYVDVYAPAYGDIEEAGIAASEMRADVKRAALKYNAQALADDDGKIGGSVSYEGAEIIDAPDGSSIEGFRITLTHTLTETYGDPDNR